VKKKKDSSTPTHGREGREEGGGGFTGSPTFHEKKGHPASPIQGEEERSALKEKNALIPRKNIWYPAGRPSASNQSKTTTNVQRGGKGGATTEGTVVGKACSREEKVGRSSSEHHFQSRDWKKARPGGNPYSHVGG